MSTQKVLISGFGEWACSSNPSKEVAESLDGASMTEASNSSVIAPSIFDEMLEVVTREIDRTSPDIVITLGEFCGRSMITIERLAQKLIDATRHEMSDASGAHPQDSPVVEGKLVADYSTLPRRAIVKAMRSNGDSKRYI